MSILETFYILFKSDASELKKGMDEAEHATKHLDESLKKVGKDSDHLGQSFLSLAKSAKDFLIAAIPAGFASAGIHHALELGLELSKTSRILNTNIQDLSAWRNAIELAGGDANQFQSTLTSLADKFGTSSDVILKLLPRYADALSRLNPARAQQIGKNLGLDEGTILLLQHSRREVEAMIARQKELSVVTQKDSEQFLKYNEATLKVKQSTQALFTVLALQSLPYLIRFFDILDKGVRFFIQHKDFVIGGLYAMAAAVTVLGIRFAIASLPIYLMSALIVGLIALFALAYDDVQAFLNGQRSLIGFFINHFPRAAQAVKSAFDIMKKAAYLLLHPIELLENALNKIRELFNKVIGSRGQVTIEQLEKSTKAIDEKYNFYSKNNAALGGGIKNSSTVNTGDITINTAATDASGIATSLKSELNQHFSQVANYHADGVTA